ncbi:hypothetical protein EDC01DRAFT_713255 [Geopyxis carbonaria]|nr:hypothetical protein EDC01DRAFT_713255 [Geopyxis carbonaria]
MKLLALGLGLLQLSTHALAESVVECDDAVGCADGFECVAIDESTSHCLPATFDDDASTSPADTPRLHSRQTAPFPPVVGAHSGIHPRLPLDSAAADSDYHNLLTLALLRLQALPESQPLSYYRIAGIHAAPFEPWTYTPAQHPGQLGYCTHASVLFATWHRPYLVLLEQELQKHAFYEARTWPRGAQRSRWEAVAQRIRLPYWDWATQRGLPDAVKPATVRVRRARGVQTRRNPWAAYSFQRADYRARYFGAPFNTQLTTTRAGNADAVVRAGFAARKRTTYDLFTLRTFSAFSTSAFERTTPGQLGSVEMVHNGIHNDVGGHMQSPDVAAFSPLFWLHHANVDRLAAMYQAVRPGSNVEPRNGSPVMGRPRGGREDVNTPLYPFRHPGGQVWTSRDVSAAADIWRWGYEYPEVPSRLRGQGQTALARAVRTQVDRLYAPVLAKSSGFKAATVANARLMAAAVPEVASASVPAAVSSLVASASSAAVAAAPAASSTTAVKTRTEWLATLIFDESQVEGPFSIKLFLNASDPATMSVSSSSPPPAPHVPIGGCASFSSKSKPPSSSNPVQRPSTTISGTIPLSDALLAAGATLDVNTTVAFLHSHLHWKILRAGDEEVPLAQLPSLEVGVSASVVTYSEDPAVLPVYGVWKTYYRVTEKKAGGMKVKDGGLLESVDVAADGKVVAGAQDVAKPA